MTLLYILWPLLMWGAPSEPVATVRFEIKNAGMTVEGSFAEVRSHIHFDPQDLPGSSLVGTVTVASLETGIGMRDRHLMGKAYFDAAKHPQIVMRSESIRRQGDQYVAQFVVTLKGVDQRLDLPFRVRREGGANIFEAQFTLNRRDFGVGESSLMLADEVKIFLRARQAASSP